MRLADEYRRYAADLLRLAGKQSSCADKSHLLRMAEAWLDMSDRAAGRMKKLRATVDHPLVEQALGPDQPIIE